MQQSNAIHTWCLRNSRRRLDLGAIVCRVGAKIGNFPATLSLSHRDPWPPDCHKYSQVGVLQIYQFCARSSLPTFQCWYSSCRRPLRPSGFWSPQLLRSRRLLHFSPRLLRFTRRLQPFFSDPPLDALPLRLPIRHPLAFARSCHRLALRSPASTSGAWMAM
jgi:hypothetical protein